jgi:hypothetical protein
MRAKLYSVLLRLGLDGRGYLGGATKGQSGPDRHCAVRYRSDAEHRARMFFRLFARLQCRPLLITRKMDARCGESHAPHGE